METAANSACSAENYKPGERSELYPMNRLVIVRISLASALVGDLAAHETPRPGDARQANKGRTDASKSRSVDDDARRVAPAMRVPSLPPPKPGISRRLGAICAYHNFRLAGAASRYCPRSN